MKYLITFAYGTLETTYLTDETSIQCHHYCQDYPTDVHLEKYTHNGNCVNFIDKTVETNGTKKLRQLIEEVRTQLIRDDTLYKPSWIKLIGITPIVNDEIEEVINDSQLMYLNDYKQIDELYSDGRNNH